MPERFKGLALKARDLLKIHGFESHLYLKMEVKILSGLAVMLNIIGIVGIVINRKNIIVILMSIELMLLAINMMLIVGAASMDNRSGEILALYILVVAAAESAIGLSILVAYYRVRGTIAVKYINLLRG